VDYLDTKDQSVFESMNVELKEKNLKTFDLPLHTAFFALKIGEGEERG
jgi:hypothetical protein